MEEWLYPATVSRLIIVDQQETKLILLVWGNRNYATAVLDHLMVCQYLCGPLVPVFEVLASHDDEHESQAAFGRITNSPYPVQVFLDPVDGWKLRLPSGTRDSDIECPEGAC